MLLDLTGYLEKNHFRMTHRCLCKVHLFIAGIKVQHMVTTL